MNLTVTQPGHIIPTGIAGFGYSGKVFHAPFVYAHAGYRLSAFVTTGNEAAQLYPSAKIYRSFKEILAAGDLELIVLCTPHPLHVSQAIEAMRAGKHVVIEKPVAMNSRDAGKLISAASETGRQWFPYHNRRWDGDFLTVRQLISSGVLGHIVEFGSHFDRYSPVVMRAGWRYLDEDGGGTLFDLGPHLIDQTIALFGKPDSVWCKLYHQRKESKASDSFDLKLFYPETTASLSAGVFMAESGPRFTVHGTKGSFIKYGTDPQEARLKNGRKSGAPATGRELKKYYGTLTTVSDGVIKRQQIPTFEGNYLRFYDNIYNVLTSGQAPEVSREDAMSNLQITEAAIRSNAEGRIVALV